MGDRYGKRIDFEVKFSGNNKLCCDVMRRGLALLY